MNLFIKVSPYDYTIETDGLKNSQKVNFDLYGEKYNTFCFMFGKIENATTCTIMGSEKGVFKMLNHIVFYDVPFKDVDYITVNIDGGYYDINVARLLFKPYLIESTTVDCILDINDNCIDEISKEIMNNE